ncbi:MAG TPA: DUF3857 domain-containing protein [Thermoanaerobaculia bacterium]|nr:DUF3857 domain-containing protein [Thermoanaerobaculia bacterium]
MSRPHPANRRAASLLAAELGCLLLLLFLALPIVALAAPRPVLAALPRQRHAASPGRPGGPPAQAGRAGQASEPWEQAPFSADPAAILRAAAAISGRDGEPVVVLFSDLRYAYDEQGRETSTHRIVYRILTAAADQSWSVIEKSWAPWHQARPEVRARVITPDGQIHALDPAVLTEGGEVQDGPDMFADGRVLRGPLPATGPGAVVEQEMTVRDTAPFFDHGTVRAIDVGSSVTVHRARLVLEAPVATPLRWLTRQLPALPAGPGREEIVAAAVPAAPADPRAAAAAATPPAASAAAAPGKIRRVTFDYRDLPPTDDLEPGLPPDRPRGPYVAFSTGSSWADIARHYSDIVDETIRGAKLEELLRSAQLTGDSTSPASQLEVMNRLLERLGEIRYTGVELGQGGIIPRTPGETLRRKFGDCKDKAVLLIAALRALDIPAYVALLNAGEDQQDIEESLPGFGDFNHAIVVVPSSPPIWIDPTDRFARAGELPTDDQGRLVLIASPTATGLVRTPEATSAENRAVKTREFFLSDLGGARAAETDEYWGASERDLRAFYTSEDPEALRESIADYMKKTYLAKELGAYDHANPLDLSHPFKLHLEAKETRRALTDERGAAVAILPATLLEQLPDELTAGGTEGQPRIADYYFSRPYSVETRYRIVPPAGYAPQPLPPRKARQLGSASYSEEYAAGDDGVVTATLRLDTGKRRINAAEFEALRAGIRELAEAKPLVLRFDQVGEARLAAGEVRESLAEFNREAAAAPRKALPHTRLARALLAGGLGEAARQEADRAVRLEPRSGLAQRVAGWVLEHDAIGRRFGSGFDRAGALAALRKAKELDPHDEKARAELAILLEHDGRGERYGADADLAGAIAEYQALRADLKSEAMDDNLLVALVRAGRFSEMKQLAIGLEETPNRLALRLVATAATDGGEAAVAEAQRKLADDKERQAALESAAQSLIVLRRYPEAGTLLGRAGRQSASAASFLARAEVLRKTRRHEEVGLPSHQPASVAKRFILVQLAAQVEEDRPAIPPRPAAGAAAPAGNAAAAIAAGQLDPRDQISSLLARPFAQSLSARERRALAQGLSPAHRAALRLGHLQLASSIDLGLAALRESVSGDDEVGYRVELTSALGDGVEHEAIFVVPEGGDYRIAALSSAPASLGAEALRRLLAHDLHGARKWLDWASEELPAAQGDPPYPPLATLWTRGAAADAEEVRCAAASLLAQGGGRGGGQGGGSALAVPLLLACRQGGDGNPRRTAIDLALATAYRTLGRSAELLDTAHRLLAARQDSPQAFLFAAAALDQMRRWPELEEAARERLQRLPGDAPAERVLARAAVRRGDLERAGQLLAALAESGRASAGDLNQLAWIALSRGRADERAIEYAQRAAALSGYQDAAALHTLASLYAERGQTAEAYRVVLQAVAAEPEGESAPSPAPSIPPAQAPRPPALSADDWYVFGRLAESYGLPEVARRLYARVAPPPPSDDAGALSTFHLAQERMRAMGASSGTLRPGQGRKGGDGATRD